MKRSIVTFLVGVVLLSTALPVMATTTVQTKIVTLDTHDRFFDVQKTLLPENNFSTRMLFVQSTTIPSVLDKLRQHGSVTIQTDMVTSASKKASTLGTIVQPQSWPDDALPFTVQRHRTQALADMISTSQNDTAVEHTVRPSTIKEGTSIMGYLQPGSPATVQLDVELSSIQSITKRSLGQGSFAQEADRATFNETIDGQLTPNDVIVFSSMDLNKYARTTREGEWTDVFGTPNRLAFILISLK